MNVHDTGIASVRCVERLPSHNSNMVVSTVSGGGPRWMVGGMVFEMWFGNLCAYRGPKPR